MSKRYYISALLAAVTLCCMSFGANAQVQEQDSVQTQAQTQPDTLTLAEFSYNDVAMILQLFDGGLTHEVIAKADQFIRFGKTEQEISNTAFHAYKYYRNSRIMGYDEVAIYIADNYFLNGAYTLVDAGALAEMKLFAGFNRSSLIGLPAPAITMQDPAGNEISILGNGHDYCILYFYDDDCPSCRKTTPALMQYLLKSDPHLNFTVYLIYTQSDRERWMDYIQKTISPFKLPDHVETVHLWDPEYTSNFAALYGVISTPKLFLLDRNNVIKGRELTPGALAQVVELEESQLTPMEEIFEQIFVPIAYSTDTTLITKEIDSFFEDSRDNPEFFHELFYTLYQYLKTSDQYTLQQGAAYLANRYIASIPEMWETVTFTNTGETHGSTIRADYASADEFIDQAALGVLLFYRNMLDRPAADLTLYDLKNKPANIYSIDAEYTVLYFYSMDCGLCNAVTKELKKLYEAYREVGVEFVGIYTGTDKKWKKHIDDQGLEWVNLWDRKHKSGMFDKYDLMDVPAIYLLDKDKVTLAKDINPDILSVLLEYYTTQEEDLSL